MRRAYSIAWRDAASLPLPLGTDHARAIRIFGFYLILFSHQNSSSETVTDSLPSLLNILKLQLKKQNDKESARDMTGYKPSNFDKGFREGKGWGDLVRVFPARFGVSRDWKVAQVFLFFPDSSPPAAVKINRQL